MHIHAGRNIPGYLPESEPACFDGLDKAIEHLRHELKDRQEEYCEQCNTADWRQDAGDDTQCECAWCDVATDVEAALSAIADGDVQHKVTQERYASWIFSPPEGADITHWIHAVLDDRDACDLNED